MIVTCVFMYINNVKVAEKCITIWWPSSLPRLHLLFWKGGTILVNDSLSGLNGTNCSVSIFVYDGKNRVGPENMTLAITGMTDIIVLISKMAGISLIKSNEYCYLRTARTIFSLYDSCFFLPGTETTTTTTTTAATVEAANNGLDSSSLSAIYSVAAISAVTLCFVVGVGLTVMKTYCSINRQIKPTDKG